MQIVTGERICPNSSYSLQKLLRLCAKGFVIKEFRNFHRFYELKNFIANIFLKLECQSCTWIHASIGQLCTQSRALKGEIVTTYTCFDNSGFLGVVTLNSPDGILTRQFFPFINKTPVSNLISAEFSYLMICLCYHAYYM